MKFFPRGSNKTGAPFYDSDINKCIKQILQGVFITDSKCFLELNTLFIPPEVYWHNILFLVDVIFLSVVYQLR